MLNPSPGQPPTASSRPHIRREQRGSPVQLAQGGCLPKPLVPTQPQDPTARAPALRRHEALVHTCVRPCASARVDLLSPSNSAAHAPRPSARNCKPAIKTNDTSPRPQMSPERAPGTPPRCTTPVIDRPSTPATTATTQPAHQLTFRHDAPQAPSAPSWTPRSLQPATVAHLARRRAPPS